MANADSVAADGFSCGTAAALAFADRVEALPGVAGAVASQADANALLNAAPSGAATEVASPG